MNNNNIDSNNHFPQDHWGNNLVKSTYTQKYANILKEKPLPENDKELKNQFNLLKSINTLTYKGINTLNGRNSLNTHFNCLQANSNIQGNRHKDVLPFDFNLTMQGAPYLNCSTIQLNFTYHVCSAPLSSQFTEFWLMVFKTKSSHIVMLTKLLEKRKVKAHCYWPGNEGDTVTFNNLQVTCTKVEEIASDLIIRTFTVKMNDEEHEVTHWHFTEWPDHDVVEPKKLFSLINRVNESMENIDSALIVHCSAGIGRSGCFVAARDLLLQPQEERSLIKTTADLRLQRAGMVQSVQQYQLIRDTIIHSQDQ